MKRRPPERKGLATTLTFALALGFTIRSQGQCVVEALLFVAGFVVALAVGWLVWGRTVAASTQRAGAAERELAAASTEAKRVPELEQQLADLRDTLTDANAQLAALRASGEERDRAHAVQLQQMKEQFGQLAGDALQRAQEQFLALADERFAKHSEVADKGLAKNKAELAELIAPMRETLARYETQLKEIETARTDAYGALKAQIANVAQGQLAVRDEASKLVTALRSSGKTAGSWGEQQLRNTLEMAGLREGIDFTLQTTTAGEEGAKRPDAIINLPGGRNLIVDSKCSLGDYLGAADADGEDGRRAAYRRHAACVRNHAKGLAEKAYWRDFGQSADFVILFLAGENFLSAALEHDLGLLGWAFDQRILLAGPINLLAIAKTVALVWRQETLAEEAQKIGALGADLHASIATMADHVARVGNNLDSAVRAYDDFVGSLERNVLPKARRFTELGVDKGKKPVAALAEIGRATRTAVAPELVAIAKPEAAE